MRTSLAILGATAVLLVPSSAMAQANAADIHWFTNLISAHMNHEFCPPPGTTYGVTAKDISAYMAAHPDQKPDMTDAEWLQMLGAIYPCKQPVLLSEAEAASLGAKPVGSVKGNYTVQPTGIYKTIDMTQANALLDVLRGPSSEEIGRQIALIQSHGGDFVPPILMQLAIAQFNSGKLNNAVFWFHAGLLRTIIDVRLSTDPSVAGVPTALITRTPLPLLKAAFSDDPSIVKIIKRVIAWDEKTSYNYDRRWIALHGTGATQSALDPIHVPTTLTLPNAQWPAISNSVRAGYLSFVLRHVVQVRAAKN